MANKTIHELTELTQGNVGTSQELAIYDVSDNSTKRVTVGNLFGIDEFLTADDDDEPTGQVDFTSEDDELSPTSTESVDLLTGNDSWSQRFYKVSQMFKNIRYILGKLGTTDISSIGNGTVTGAISNLNNNLTSTENKTINISSGYSSSITANGIHCLQREDKTAFVFGTFTIGTAISSSSPVNMFTGFPFTKTGTMWITATHVSSKDTVRIQFKNDTSSAVMQQNYTAYSTGEYIITPFFYYVTD